jgi:hypothetical protein
MNIPPAIGAILGSIFGGPLNDWCILQVAKRRGGIYEPETRLWSFMLPGVCMPIGLFMFGLTIAKVRFFESIQPPAQVNNPEPCFPFFSFSQGANDG